MANQTIFKELLKNYEMIGDTLNICYKRLLNIISKLVSNYTYASSHLFYGHELCSSWPKDLRYRCIAPRPAINNTYHLLKDDIPLPHTIAKRYALAFGNMHLIFTSYRNSMTYDKFDQRRETDLIHVLAKGVNWSIAVSSQLRAAKHTIYLYLIISRIFKATGSRFLDM